MICCIKKCPKSPKKCFAARSVTLGMLSRFAVSRTALVDITPKKVYNNIRLHFSEVKDDKNRRDRLQLLS